MQQNNTSYEQIGQMVWAVDGSAIYSGPFSSYIFILSVYSIRASTKSFDTVSGICMLDVGCYELYSIRVSTNSFDTVTGICT